MRTTVRRRADPERLVFAVCAMAFCLAWMLP